MARTMRERYVKALRLLRIGVSHLLIIIHRAPYDVMTPDSGLSRSSHAARLGYCGRKTKPAIPDRRTSNQGDHFQNCSKPNAARTMSNATDESTATVQTGL
jgi:hypothetical protein